MDKKFKILITFFLLAAIFCSNYMVSFSDDYISADKKIDPCILDMSGLSEEDIICGNYVDDGTKYPCAVFFQEMDMEPAIRYGFDEAEKTREIPSEDFNYPYHIIETKGDKEVIVDIKSGEDDIYVQTYIEAKREYVQKYYSKYNKCMAEKCLENINVDYISQFSPCIFTCLTVKDISNIIQNEDVSYVGFFDSSKVCNSTYGGEALDDSPNNAYITTNVNACNVDGARGSYGVTGSGVKIGQLEGFCPYDEPNDDITIVYNPNANTKDNHATGVFRIMRAVAEDASYYASGVTNSTYALSTNTEWLLSKGVNIINMSFGLIDENDFYSSLYHNKYDTISRWLDHIAYNHDVHIVISAGNEGSIGVRTPAMAYNVITVGNVYGFYNNGHSAYSLFEGGAGGNYGSASSYNNGGANYSQHLAFKPDVSAPGVYQTYVGTSYSAPIVTGTIALMCNYDSSLKTKQHVVKSIIASSALKEHRYTTTNSNFKKYGAGVLDAKKAVYAVVHNTYNGTGSVTSSSPSVTYYMTVTSSDTCMRVALAYANRIKFSSSNHSLNDSVLNGNISELKLQVYSPGGTQVSSCTTSGANLKVVEFDPRPYGTGSYRIVVTQTSATSSDRITNFGIGWR